MKRALFVVFLVGCSARPASSGKDPHALFTTVCAPCHGPDGHAKTPQGQLLGAKDLAGDEARHMTDEMIRIQIRNGKNRMPAFGPVLSASDVDALVGEVRKIQGH